VCECHACCNVLHVSAHSPLLTDPRLLFNIPSLFLSRWDFTWDDTVEYPLRIEYLAPAVGSSQHVNAPPPALTIMWRLSPTAQFVPVPLSSMSPAVTAPELERQRMQDALGRGFSTWWRPSATTHARGAPLDCLLRVLLGSVARCQLPQQCAGIAQPSVSHSCATLAFDRLASRVCIANAALVVSIAPTSLQRTPVATSDTYTNTHTYMHSLTHQNGFQVHLPTGFGIEVATVDTTAGKRFTGGIVDRCTGDADCTVRPGPHTYNGSYTKLTTRIRGPASAPTLLVVTESAHIDGANGHAVVVSDPPPLPPTTTTHTHIHTLSRFASAPIRRWCSML
jgi:hypothetical protein